MKRALPLFCLSWLASTSNAQEPMVDITMADNGNQQLEIRVRPDGPFNGVVSNLTFTIRWPEAAGVALDTAQALFPAGDYMYPAATQPVSGGNGYMYRTFNAVGLVTMAEFGHAWVADLEYPICTIDMLVPGTECILGNDAWTAANNRDFYCSLGGIPVTGDLFESANPSVDIRSYNEGTGSLGVVLVPQEDFFGWITSIDFTLRWPTAAGVELGEPMVPEEVSDFLSIAPVGSSSTSGQFTYQRYHGEGTASLANSASGWLAGSEHLVLSIPLFGDAEHLMIVNDEWTAAHDGDYSILLNGLYRPGNIEDVANAINSVTGVGPSLDVTVSGDELIVRSGTQRTDAPLVLSLLTATGQVLWSETLPSSGTPTNTRLNISEHGAGVYILRAAANGQNTVYRFVR